MEAKEYIPISVWATEDRPREKLLQRGKSSLTNAELIAILIGSGSRNQSAVELSQTILRFNKDSLSKLGRVGVKDLMKFKGIGEAKAISIVAALEIGRRRQSEEPLERKKISSSVASFDILSPILSDLNHEEFWVVFLDRANKVISTDRISLGGIHGTVVDPKVVFKLALDHKACGLILGHNHPSGTLNPSQADIQLTDKLSSAGEFLEIRVLDHIIVADNKYYSFADNNKL